MPSESEHLTQAERNEILYKSLCSLDGSLGEYTEWEVVALFYSALHYVDAYLDRQGNRHPKNHKGRNGLVSKTNELAAFAPYYMHLYRSSVDARYELIRLPAADVQSLKREQYDPLKGHVRALLGV